MNNEGVIPFIRTFEPKDMTTVKYSKSETDANGVTEKTTAEVPVVPLGGSREQILYMMSCFDRARDSLGWTTGPKVFQNFRKQFEDPTEWETIAANQNQSINGFNAARTIFLRTKFPSNAWERHVDMLRAAKKPFKLNPQEFSTLLKYHNSILSLLPGKPAQGDPTSTRLTDYEIRMTLFKSMPLSYQQNFRNAGNSTMTATLADMEGYFEMQYDNDDRVQMQKARGNGGSKVNRFPLRGNQFQRRDDYRGPFGSRFPTRGPTGRGFSGRGFTQGRGMMTRGRGQGGYYGPGRGYQSGYQSGYQGGYRNVNPNRYGSGGFGRGGFTGRGNGGGSGYNRPQGRYPQQGGGRPGGTNDPRGNVRSGGEMHMNEDVNQDAHHMEGVEQNPNEQQWHERDAHHNDRCDEAEQHYNDYDDGCDDQFGDMHYQECVEEEDIRYNDYEGDLEGCGDADMFFIDCEQLNADDESQCESDDDSEPPPLIPRHRSKEPTPITWKRNIDVSPHTIVQASKVSNVEGRFIFKTLFDSGATMNAVKKSVLPKNVETKPLPPNEGIQTTNGRMKPREYVVLDTVVFPEFSPNRHVKSITCFVFEEPNLRYDLILGRDTLSMMGIQFDFKNKETTWFDKRVPFHPVNWHTDKEAIRQVLAIKPKAVRKAEQGEIHVSEITAAHYEKADLEEVATSLTHLTKEQQQDLLEVFMKHEPLFNGKVGRFPRDFHLEVDPSVEPYCQTRPYPLNAQHLDLLKAELDRQEEMGLIDRCFVATKWCMPMFVRPKKDSTIRTVHDFRRLNKAIIRKKHILPRIEDVVHKTKKYKYITKLDVSMQYYTFWLDKESREYCVFITPFGKYYLNVLAMGCVQSGDFAQAAMEETLQDLLDQVTCYMDDIKFEDMEWKDHLHMTDAVLERLQRYGFTVNPLKCEWAVEETDFLGYRFTPDGVRPWLKRIEPIMRMETPKTVTELRRFIGMVNFYRPMFQGRAHVLSPLTGLTKIAPQSFKKQWKEEHDKAFKEVKAMVSRDVLVQYPDLNDEFLIETDASNFQLGAVIKQKGRPIAFYSRKLTTAQRKYSTIEKELLSILEVLEQYRSLLWGRQIRVRTDHKNISFDNMKSNRVRNWRLLVEDFHPIIEFYPGEKNVEADTLSRHPTSTEQTTSSEILDEMLLNYPEHINQFPGQFQGIRQSQQANQQILDLANEDDYEFRNYGGHDLVCRRNQAGEWRIVVPGVLVNDLIEWCHITLSHPGITRMEKTIGKLFYIPSLR